VTSAAAEADDDDDDTDGDTVGDGWDEDEDDEVTEERFPRCWSFVNPLVFDSFTICISCINNAMS